VEVDKKTTMVAVYGPLRIRLPAWLSHGRTLLHAQDVDEDELVGPDHKVERRRQLS